jgi:hypothetical protein
MSAPVQSLQHGIVERLRSPDYGWSGDALAVDCSVAEEAADEIVGLREANHHYRDGAAHAEKLIATLKARAEQAERAVDVLESQLAAEKDESASYHKFWIEERHRREKLAHPFRSVDALDWKHLLSFIPESGHGKFWKAVFAEVRAALESQP